MFQGIKGSELVASGLFAALEKLMQKIVAVDPVLVDDLFLGKLGTANLLKLAMHDAQMNGGELQRLLDTHNASNELTS